MLVRFVCEQVTEDSNKLLWNVTSDSTENNMKVSQITATYKGSNRSQASSWTVIHYPTITMQSLVMHHTNLQCSSDLLWMDSNDWPLKLWID